MMHRESDMKKVLMLLQYLQDESSKTHPIHMPALLEHFVDIGMPTTRKSIYHLIQVLKDTGFEITYENRGYYLERPFTVGEITFLTQCVQDAISLSTNCTVELNQKLLALLSFEEAQRVQMIPAVHPKSANEETLETMELINNAQIAHRTLRFLYSEIDFRGTKTYRNQGNYYTVLPLAIVVQNGKAYMVCYSFKHEQITQFRIDKMEETSVKQESDLAIPFRLEDWLEQSFHMYSGRKQTVSIRFDRNMYATVYDNFGDDMIISSISKEEFVANIKTAITPTLIGWILQFHKRCTVLRPQALIEEIVATAASLYEQYKTGT